MLSTKPQVQDPSEHGWGPVELHWLIPMKQALTLEMVWYFVLGEFIQTSLYWVYLKV